MLLFCDATSLCHRMHLHAWLHSLPLQPCGFAPPVTTQTDVTLMFQKHLQQFLWLVTVAQSLASACIL
jgi:hypothetical protein